MKNIHIQAIKAQILPLIGALPNQAIARLLGLDTEDGNGANKGWLFHYIIQDMVNDGTVIKTGRKYTPRLNSENQDDKEHNNA